MISAICTHLGCVIHWNDLEKSWDCPYQGSRFTASGKVIEGPTVEVLHRIDEDETQRNPSPVLIVIENIEEEF